MRSEECGGRNAQSYFLPKSIHFREIDTLPDGVGFTGVHNPVDGIVLVMVEDGSLDGEGARGVSDASLDSP